MIQNQTGGSFGHTTFFAWAVPLLMAAAGATGCGSSPGTPPVTNAQFLGTWHVQFIDAVKVTSPVTGNNTTTSEGTMTVVEQGPTGFQFTLGTIPCTLTATVTSDTEATLSSDSCLDGPIDDTVGTGTLTIAGGTISAVFSWNYHATQGTTSFFGTDTWTISGGR